MLGEILGRDARLELFVRSSTPAAARERQSIVVERLRALEDYEEVVIRSWERRAPIDGRENDGIHELYDAFAEWAGKNGVDLCPFFDTRECHSSLTGDSHTALVLPVMCLAVYDDDRLRAMFPHVDDGQPVAVGDALDALEGNSHLESILAD